jgi:hypothetical protein
MQNQTLVHPVVRWGTSKAIEHQIGLIRLAYLTQAGQTDEQATESPIYGFSPQQLRALAESLTQTADQLESASRDKRKNS